MVIRKFALRADYISAESVVGGKISKSPCAPVQQYVALLTPGPVSRIADRLCDALGISGLTRLRLIDAPAVARPLGIAFAFAMALSLGDLGTIALFGSDQVITLPYLLLERMSSYRTTDAAGLALILGVMSLALIALADRSLSNRRGGRA